MQYQPIPQIMTINGKKIGTKDLWLVHTDLSDCWIRRTGANHFQVFDYDLKRSLLICESMEESLKFIKEIRKEFVL